MPKSHTSCSEHRILPIPLKQLHTDLFFQRFSNIQARATYTAKGVESDLANNIAHGVRWSDATEVAVELGSGYVSP